VPVIGTSVRRPDVPGKVTGAARYAGDLALPGMLHAKIKRSNVAHANIRRIDTTKALAYPGVKAVLTHLNVPRVLHYGSPHPRSASLACDQYILDNKVRYWGEGVAAVAAISEEIAEEALDLIELEYEELPALVSVEQALASSVLIHGTKHNLVTDPVLVKRGDVERGFAEADLVIEGTYEMGRPTPAYMEPNVCLFQWDDDGKLTAWISTQTPFMVRGILAEVLGVPLT
jgi:xanthine dehydrogenase molybdenum-binding subunit